MRRMVPEWALCLVLIACALCTSASAADFPVKPITMVMPFAAGGPTDLIGRLVCQKLSAVLGQPIIIDNRPGAGGTLASAFVARAAADGYTLLYASASTHAITPALYQKLGYDAEKDFAPVSQVVISTSVLLVDPALPISSVADLIAYGKANPGRLNYGSAGNGTPSHLGVLFFNRQVGIDAVHIPYRSGGAAMTGLLQGQLSYLQDAIFSAWPHIEAGKVRVLAVASDQRANALPNVPTLREAGVSEHMMGSWSGIVAPAGTPASVIDRLQAAIRETLASPEVQETLARYDAKPVGSGPAEFAQVIAGEIRRWKAAVAEAGLTIE